MVADAAPIALIAGEGDLPRLIAEDRARRGALCRIVHFGDGPAPAWAAEADVIRAAFEKPGRLFRALRADGIATIAMAGAMRRPEIRLARLDLKALTLAPRLLPLMKGGDDALLRAVSAVFEGEGFAIAAAHELVEGLLAPGGDLAARKPGEDDLADIARARAIAAALGAVDVGQGAVVDGGVCIAAETVQGTDAMLAAAAACPAELRPASGRPSGVLYKGPKPGQDWRVDLPAIGPETIRRAAEAGLAGVAVQAGGVLVLGLEETVREADRLGLFLHGCADAAGGAA